VHVGLLCNFRLPVPRYGGTERVIVWLARGLQALGHEVTVVAARGTKLPDTRVIHLDIHPKQALPTNAEDRLPPDVDVTHYHTPVYNPPRRPYIETQHGNAPDRPAGPRTVYVSRDHALRHGGATFVHNGLDPAEYGFDTEKDDYLLFLGRLHRVKGYREAMAIAHRRRERLVVAGGWRLVWRPGVRYVGRVGGERKRRLLARARALVAPVQWDEPFGLTIIEALVSGTPVVGTPRGALPEIITDEVGELHTSIDALAASLDRVANWAPDACRARVLEHFTHLSMTRAYLEQYAHVIEHGRLLPNV
jgi:glycosyltransferase involved in cell wall biosynthesis